MLSEAGLTTISAVLILAIVRSTSTGVASAATR